MLPGYSRSGITLNGLVVLRGETRASTVRDETDDATTPDMSMAVDEMIVWMSLHECFPHNLSVSNMVSIRKRITYQVKY